MQHMLWLVLLGVLLAGYLVTDGYTFGVGLLRLRLARGEDERRLSLTAVGPYFLGNEVWLVAAAGVLFGGFPDLEGSLLAGFYPLVVVVVGALIARDGGMWFRSRRESRAWRTAWDRVIVAGSAALAMGWGLVLGNLLEGVPSGHAAPAGLALFDPYALLCGATFVALVACHGAVFLAMRTQGPMSSRAAELARRLLGPATALLVVAAGLGFAAGGADRPIPAALVGLAALLPLWLARRRLEAGRPGGVFAATGSAVVLPVVAVAVGQAPTLTSMTAGGSTLAVLGAFLMVVLPAMALAQLWLWRAFRGPVTAASHQYF